MAKGNNRASFTLRTSPEMKEQLERRAQINRRSLNEEVNYLLEKQLDAIVEADLALTRGTASGR